MEDLALHRGVERLRECVVGRRPDGTHGLGYAELAAELGVGLRAVDRPVVAVKHGAFEAAPGRGSGGEGVLDELGAHVIRDRPPGEPTGVAVDHGGQVQVRPVGQRQVGDVPDVALVGALGGEVTLEQVGVLLARRLGNRGPA